MDLKDQTTEALAVIEARVLDRMSASSRGDGDDDMADLESALGAIREEQRSRAN